MAKRKTTTELPQHTVDQHAKLPKSTAELAADPRNPRFINPAAEEGLAASLAEFGDLSGIVWNRQTGQLVTGHQRMAQITTRWGPQPVEIIDAATELGAIRIDNAHTFAVRVVDWSPEKQAAANATANNPLIQGEFTSDLANFLADSKLIMADTSPSLFDDVLLMDLMAQYAPDQEPTELKSIDVKPPPAMAWILIGIETPRFGRIAHLVDELAAVPDVTIETTAVDRE